MFIALWGMIASTRADYLWVAAHSALVFGLVFIFVIYILLSIAFGKYVGSFSLDLPAVAGGWMSDESTFVTGLCLDETAGIRRV